MKKVLLFTLFALLSLAAIAQQEAQYTQFMYNKLGYNPGYAGSLEAICATAIIRSQWLGVEGAPKSQVLSFDAALFNNRVGLGFNFARNTIGISSNFNADIAYAYRFSVGEGMLGIGLQGSIRYFSTDYSDPRIIATQAINTDASIPVGDQAKYTPNFGAGLYYKSDNFYLGFSAPRLLENNIDFSEDATVISRSVRHFYLMTGYAFDLNEKVQMQPQALFKYAENTPFDIDLNLSFIFSNKYALGVTYRVGGSSEGIPAESIDVLFSAQISKNLLFGIAYDVTISEIRDYTSGSIEAMLRYCFKSSSKEEKEGEGDYLNPRFF